MSSVPETVEPARSSSLRRDLAFRVPSRFRIVWIALALLLVLCAVSAAATLNGASLGLVTALAGVLAIASIGQLLAIVAGGIDLSIPAVMTLAAAMLLKVSGGDDGKLVETIAITLAVTTGIGVVNGLLIAYVRLNALIVTLAMAGTVSGATLLWAGISFSASGHVPATVADISAHKFGWLSAIAVIAIAMLAVVAFVLHRTRAGRSYLAAGTNRRAAITLGVPVRRNEVLGYAAAGLAYGVAGILLAGLLKNPDYSLGTPYQLQTIVAVALGGAALSGGPASAAATGAACLFLALLDQYLAIKGFAPGVRELASGSVLVIAVALVSLGQGGRARLAVLRQRYLGTKLMMGAEDR